MQKIVILKHNFSHFMKQFDVVIDQVVEASQPQSKINLSIDPNILDSLAILLSSWPSTL